jgi:hypothetical protein
MAATYPSGEPDRDDDRPSRPILASTPVKPARPSWIGIVIAVAVIAVAAIVAYLIIYNGGSSGGTSGGGSGGGGGGGYLVLAFTGDQARRLATRVRTMTVRDH